MSPGMMIAGSILLGKATGPIDQLIAVWKQWSGAKSAYLRLNELLSANPVREVGMQLPKPNGVLTMEGVTAAPPGYPTAVIKGLSFSVQPGDVLGIIGASGCGKSTIARLLVGIWPAAVGKVRLDGADIYHWNKAELGPHLGYLPQDIELFGGSIAQNIARFGDVNSEQVIEAAKRSGVHDMILHFPQGYDTLIGDGGAGLSGGQRQRIGLARAMYGDPSLLVLDEPNSNLDETGEKALLVAINDLRQRGKTIVLITHRPNVLGATNKIMLVENGAASLFGPSNDVMMALNQAHRKAQEEQQKRIAEQTKPQANTGEKALSPEKENVPEDAQERIEAANNAGNEE
jgi:ATP-binding cassette subfamily C exporter for protease/lipase